MSTQAPCALAALCFSLLAGALPAQIVHVANYTDVPFVGWKRCTIDVPPPHVSGRVTGGGAPCDYVLGRRVGLDTHVVDLKLQLQPWEVASYDLSTATATSFQRGALPANPVSFFGFPTIAGERMRVVSATPDGAAWLVHLRARTGPMLCTDLWVWWWPDQPGWAQGEVVVTASNGGVRDVKTAVPAGFELRCGSALTLVPRLPPGSPLLPAGTTFGDGQARSFPLVLIWPQHLTSVSEAAAAWATSRLAIAANGIHDLWPDGNPQWTSAQSPLQWTVAHFPGALARLHGWDEGPLGVAAYSGQTGAQEDQVFVGGECMVMPDGLGAEQVRYLVALGQSRRPCHHLELDGSQLMLAAHPSLVMWEGRPHWNSSVSPDRLGKFATINSHVTHGWWGPDEEHLLINTLSIAARLTGSPALQWQLSANARAFLFEKTVAPTLSTSRSGAARAVGWEGLAAVHLWTNLEDRALAQQVASRWRDRVRLVHVPQLGGRVADIWDQRLDPRLASTGWRINWLPYQQSVGAWGLDYACRLIGPASGRVLARNAALAVGSRAFSYSGGQWIGWGYVGFDGTNAVPLVEGAGAHYGAGIETWLTLGLATLRLHYPNDPAVQAVWAQFAASGGSWVPPGL